MRQRSLLIFFTLNIFIISFSKADPELFKTAVGLYSEGKYKATVSELDRIELRLKKDSKVRGLVYYWKGMSYNRLQEFQLAEKEFKKSLSVGYVPKDLNYELGQTLFALEKLPEAKVRFSESFKRSFKMGTSLYYMAFISKELGEKENAETLFVDVVKTSDPEEKEVRQAAQMQLADMNLSEAESKPDVFRVVESEIIPQYQKAIEFSPNSPVASKAQEKIISLQKKYELVLFQLRNGRPTLIPPYFLRAAQEVAVDSNVTFSPTETTIAKSKQSSVFTKTEFLGRYTFYHKNYFSYAPEFRFNNTYYFNRVPEIYRNDNYLLSPSVRTAYEHTLFGNPASHLFDFDYTQAERDVNEKQKLEFSFRSYTFMGGEKFKFFSQGETILRAKLRIFQSYLSPSDSKTVSFVGEQLFALKALTFMLYTSLDFTRVEADVFDTNAMTIRGDLLLPKYKDWFTPSVGLGLTVTDPMNDRQARGLETLLSPSLRLNRQLKKNWKLNSRFEYHQNNSKDKANFDYKRHLVGVELEYVY